MASQGSGVLRRQAPRAGAADAGFCGTTSPASASASVVSLSVALDDVVNVGLLSQGWYSIRVSAEIDGSPLILAEHPAWAPGAASDDVPSRPSDRRAVSRPFFVKYKHQARYYA